MRDSFADKTALQANNSSAYAEKNSKMKKIPKAYLQKMLADQASFSKQCGSGIDISTSLVNTSIQNLRK